MIAMPSVIAAADSSTLESNDSLPLRPFVLDSYPSDFPHAPENITGVPGPTYIDLHWQPTMYDGGSPVIAVYIYNVGYDDDATPLVKLDPGTRSYRIDGLNPGQSYIFHMRSENVNGIGWWSSSNWAIVGRTVPGTPTSLHVTAGQAQANLSWEASSDGGLELQGYRIYGGTNRTNLSYFSTVDEYSRNFVATGLQLGAIYYFQVSAFNAFGEGGRSEIGSVRNGYAPRNCVVSPTNFNDCSPHDVTITWLHPAENYSHVVAYRIYYRPSGAPFVYRDYIAVDRANTSIVLEDVGGWNLNFYAVAAVYDNGDEVYSNGVWVSHPMCEGFGFGPMDVLLICFIVVLIGLIVLVAFVALSGSWNRKKR
ncbi:MAG TPA: fibronectin type III domain-containing protein [Methanomassiliicoccales archaeon]|nr:fibronectin type III domain-containing protein [Methanomassiliicoccales archaeon]